MIVHKSLGDLGFRPNESLEQGAKRLGKRLKPSVDDLARATGIARDHKLDVTLVELARPELDVLVPQAVRPMAVEAAKVFGRVGDREWASFSAGGFVEHRLRDWMPGYAETLEQEKYIPPSERPHNLRFGAELADQLRPTQASARRLLERIVDVRIVEKTTEPPRGRYTSGYADSGDLGFQYEVQKLVDMGVITSDTLVLCNTGHDIPVLAQLAQNGQLSVQGAFNLDSDGLMDGSASRVRDQAQTWGDEIAMAFANNATKQGALFIGLECHRSTRFDASLLPSLDQLREYGIRRIVMLIEAPPDREYGLRNQYRSIDAFVGQAEAAGMPVVVKGLDYRVTEARKASVSFRSFTSFYDQERTSTWLPPIRAYSSSPDLAWLNLDLNALLEKLTKEPQGAHEP